MQILDRPSLFNRSDTFFGVCQGLGDDLGFHPNFLRLAFALILFWNPLAALGGYAGAAVLVLATRLISPVPAAPESGQAEAVAAAEAAPDEQNEQLPLAA